MSRKFLVRVKAEYLMEYEVDLDGTVDPEQISGSSLWLHVTEKMTPAREELRSESLVSAEEIQGQ
jgi:hypothetical protein